MKEQALINHAHTPTDRRILDGLRGTEFEHERQIHALWQGKGSRAEAASLIREIQSVSVIVHSDPDQLCHAPFATDSFSLHPGTLKGKFTTWQETNEALDPNWDDGRLPWLAKKLTEMEDEEDVQGNQPIRYEFLPVKSKYELYAPLIVLHPKLVGYSKKLGLTLYPSEQYECDVPSYSERKERGQYGYRLESYERHIELVYRAFVQEKWLDWITAVGRHIEQVYNWQPGIVCDMAQLVVCLHDVGKLSTGWQGWAREWQSHPSVNNPIQSGETAAHTDYDPTNQKHQELNRKMRGKRPNHAVESAYAAVPILLSLLPDKKEHMPLLRAAFTAISRHHGAFTSQPGSYQLEAECGIPLQATAVSLPESLKPYINPAKLQDQLSYDFKVQRRLDEWFFVQPDNSQDMVCYMILVRALRFADQEGTKRGGFVQLLANPGQVENITSFTLLTSEMSHFPKAGLVQQLDDCDPKMTFAHADIYDKKKPKRIIRHIVFPYRLKRSSRSYSLYEYHGT